ncbi:MAG: carboxylating nicotinate-nucleotide diphosphorylase [Gammaproteobacteria bacterium]|uniref:Probable nicotinate-nucleotide pyrophosphorylase [carboxylating] n=1 Tax=Candidatus Thiopontia autotrophica TaxID=2841688 RepID=A0A8J6NVV8_9GAMM|nr:carboxylating nicotinate-nucleotide diphosphorylase [Candidatus Thiopontia autotrophica]
MNHPDQSIYRAVSNALEEDIQSGDVTAQLIPEKTMATATILTRDDMVLCGREWVDESFHQLDPSILLTWNMEDGAAVSANQILVTIQGSARALLTAERTAMNFLQTLSATATITRQYTEQIAESHAEILDTRKTIPGMREAQKYAVHCGGGTNHRMGLYDAFLIKENHIAACGSIKSAVERAREISSNEKIEVEVESINELNEAVAAESDVIMLDNFSLQQMREAVSLNSGRALLEVSGNVSLEQLKDIADTGVDYISIGALTKHVHAIDLSMRLSIDSGLS